jgi:hypothetical protein
LRQAIFIRVVRSVDDLRLMARPGLVASVPDSFGAELVSAGLALELTHRGFMLALERPLDEKRLPTIAPPASESPCPTWESSDGSVRLMRA